MMKRERKRGRRELILIDKQLNFNKWQGPALGARSYIYCTVLYCTVQFCTVLYCTVLYSTVLLCSKLTKSRSISGDFSQISVDFNLPARLGVFTLHTLTTLLYCKILYSIVQLNAIFHCNVLYIIV